MTASLPPSPLRPIAQSLGLHALLFAAGLVATLRSADVSLAPLGERLQGDPTVVEIIVPTAEDRAASAAVSTPADDPTLMPLPTTAPKKAKAAPLTPVAAAPTPPATAFGFRDGTATTGPLGVPDGVAASDKERYLYELKVLLDARKVYPPLSRQMRETGSVLLEITLQKDGRIGAVAVKDPSHHARLNRAAESLVRELAVYKPLPSSLGANELSVEVPINYRLN